MVLNLLVLLLCGFCWFCCCYCFTDLLLVPPSPPRFFDNNTLITSPGPITVVRGANVSVTCFSYGSPPPEYRWLLPNRDTILGEELIIENVQAQNEGFYTCIVNNTMTPNNVGPIAVTNSSDVELLVLCKCLT